MVSRWKARSIGFLGIMLLCACFIPSPALGDTTIQSTSGPRIFEIKLTVIVGEARAFVIFNPITLPAPAFLQDGEVMAPLSLWAEAKQGNITWDKKRLTATLTTWKGSYVLTAGDPTMVWNGTPTALPSTPTLIKGSLYVPLRSLAVASGDRWEWQSGSKEMILWPKRFDPHAVWYVESNTPPASWIQHTISPPSWVQWTLRAVGGIFLALIAWLVWVLVEDRNKIRTLKRPCPNCTERVDPRFDTCPQCGARIENELPVPRLISCPYCFRTIFAGSTECPWCLKGLEPEVKPSKRRLPSTRNLASGMILFAVFWLMIGVLTVSGWHDQSDQIFLFWLDFGIGVLIGILIGMILRMVWSRIGKAKVLKTWALKMPEGSNILLVLEILFFEISLSFSGVLLPIVGTVLALVLAFATPVLISCLWWIALQLSRGKWPPDTESPSQSLSSFRKTDA